MRRDDTRYTHSKPLSDSLVPILSKAALETTAEHFLRIYCPEALQQPMALDANRLAESMGLTVQSHRITPDGSVFGRIYFYDGEAEFFDDGSPSKMPVAAGTICTDPDTFYRGAVGKANNTVVHECGMCPRIWCATTS